MELKTETYSDNKNTINSMSIYKSKNYKRNIYQKLKGRCAYCGDPILFHHMSTDHYYPRSKLKMHFLRGRLPKNFQNILLPCCRPCNEMKNDLFPEDFKIIFGRDFYFETQGFQLPHNLNKEFFINLENYEKV